MEIKITERRHLLAFLRNQGESQANWEALLQDLYRRGLEGKHLGLIACHALTNEDSERLEQVAKNRVLRIGRRAANGRTYEDLLQEAMVRVLDGSRQWFPENVGFVPYLRGVIWSIASEWAGHHKRKANWPEYAVPESQITKADEEGHPLSPFADLKTREPNIEEQIVDSEIEAERKALADEIEAHFSEDEEATHVLKGWQDGMHGPAIQKEFGFSETTYRTIVRRINRNLQKMLEEHYGQQSKQRIRAIG